MSKSLGNFITVRDLLDKGVRGEVIRLALLSTYYRGPLNWTDKLLEDAKKTLDYFYRKDPAYQDLLPKENPEYKKKFEYLIQPLLDDINIPEVISRIYFELIQIDKLSIFQQVAISDFLQDIIGVRALSYDEWFKGEGSDSVETAITARTAAKNSKNWKEADRIRDELKSQGIILEDKPDGTTDWRRA
jgi:cysteinyl-tRNA synthetase